MAIKTVYDHVDGLVQSPHDIQFVKEEMYDYFKVREMFGSKRTVLGTPVE